MNTKRLVLATAFCLTAVAVGFAADPNVGSWKINEAKSKIAAGAPKNLTVVYTAAGDSYKCVVDGVDGTGKPAHNEWTGKFGGKDYPVTGDPTADSRSLKLVSPGRYALTNKKDGKTVLTGTVVFSTDNKTRTLTTHMTDAAGKKTTNIAVAIWFPPSTWTQIPFLDNWPARFQSTVDGIALLKRVAVAGWHWAFLGGYHASSDLTVTLMVPA